MKPVRIDFGRGQGVDFLRISLTPAPYQIRNYSNYLVPPSCAFLIPGITYSRWWPSRVDYGLRGLGVLAWAGWAGWACMIAFAGAPGWAAWASSHGCRCRIRSYGNTCAFRHPEIRPLRFGSVMVIALENTVSFVGKDQLCRSHQVFTTSRKCSCSASKFFQI